MCNCPTELELANYIDYGNNDSIEKHLLTCNKCLDTVIFMKQLNKNKNINLNMNLNDLNLPKQNPINNIFYNVYKNSGLIVASITLLLLFNFNVKFNENNVLINDDIESNFLTKINVGNIIESEILLSQIIDYDNNFIEI